jgi:hypothetical protein
VIVTLAPAASEPDEGETLMWPASDDPTVIECSPQTSAIRLSSMTSRSAGLSPSIAALTSRWTSARSASTPISAVPAGMSAASSRAASAVPARSRRRANLCHSGTARTGL